MKKYIKIFLYFLFLAVFLEPVYASSEDDEAASPSTKVEKEKKKTLDIHRENSLRFGKLATISGGTVIIDPSSNSRTTSGDITFFRKSYGAAKYKVEGEPDQSFYIFLPSEIIINSGNGQNLTITNITSYPKSTGTLDSSGKNTIYVGGTLNVNSGMSEGEYEGSFDIQVEYH